MSFSMTLQKFIFVPECFDFMFINTVVIDFFCHNYIDFFD